MFYAQFVLAKKGPLAKIWLAAHWEKKLTKAQICETDVPQAIEEVIRPKVKMALRTVGHLLIGIVRIYSKKTRYLLADTNEAYTKLKINFRDGFTFEADTPFNAEDVDCDFSNFPEDFNITVPEFHDADYNERLIMANVSRMEDITLKDDIDYNGMFKKSMEDDELGLGADLDQLERLYGSVEPSSLRPTPLAESIMEMARDDSVINGMPLTRSDMESILLSESPRDQVHPIELMDNADYGSELVLNPKYEDITAGTPIPIDVFDSMMQPDEQQLSNEPQPMDIEYRNPDLLFENRARTPESFALEPLDLDNMEGGRKKRQRKPRKLLVDEETMISNENFRKHQEDFFDTLQSVQLAPPSRKMLTLCISGDLQHLMGLPGSKIKNKDLLAEYRKCLVAREFDANYTMQELSDGSSCTPSMERRAAPWEDLELNENIQEDLGVPPPIPLGIDDFYDDVNFDMGDNYGLMGFNERHDNTMGNDIDPMPGPAEEYKENNKENEAEEEWSDPFGSSYSSRGRLEAYGFGNTSTASAHKEDKEKWTRRANHILKKISTDIETSGRANFSCVTSSAKTRKHAAEQFYSLLSLAKSQIVTVEQVEPYGEIVIQPGEKFQEAMTRKENAIIRTPMRPISS